MGYPRPGEILLGKYRVEAPLGAGGMGAVVRARHLDLGADVALKVLLPDRRDKPETVARFLREGRAAARLTSDHAARVMDAGRLDDGAPYIAMELLDGPDLARVLKVHGALPAATAALLVLQACEAIAEAHALGIVHRDIKSSNLVVLGELAVAPRVKVLDFGIATAPEGASDLTDTGSVFGTPAYMAPEQMRSSRSADERSDLWSLGVVLYELLEGVRPFRGEHLSALAMAVGMDAPAPMVRAPASLRAVVARCLDKAPERRYQTVAELAAELEPHAADAAQARVLVDSCARHGRGSRRARSATPVPVPTESVPTATLQPPTVIDRPSPPRRWRLGIAVAGTIVAGAVAAIVAVVAARSSSGEPPPAAVAPPANDEATMAPEMLAAKRHAERASELFAAGSFEEAREAYGKAYELVPLAPFLLNIAQCERNLGQRDRAIATLRRYVASELDPAMRKSALETIRSLESR